MILALRLFICFGSMLLASCLHTSSTDKDKLWIKALESEIEGLGALNWIIITDSSFPALGNTVSHTIISPSELPETLHEVIQTIEARGHIEPRFYMTRESQEMEESYAPGITRHRELMQNAMHGHEVYALPEQSLRMLALESGKQYRILVIKSQTNLPYTSVYLELESGYWNSESETALRRQMENGR